MKLHFEDGSRDRITIEKRNDNGDLIGRGSWKFESDRDFARAAKLFGVNQQDIIRYVDAFQRGTDDEFPVGRVVERAKVMLRGRFCQAGSARACDNFGHALGVLDYEEPEPLIYWEGTEQLAMLDVDYHDRKYEDRPTLPQLYALAELVRPRPRWLWSTHGRGLRLVYENREPFTAGELAAIGAVFLSEREPSATCEIKTVTRHPGYIVDGRSCGQVKEQQQDVDISAVRAWIGERETNSESVETWLQEKGLEKGKRYEHSSCPVRPDEASHGSPVVVRDEGVYCHSCAGRGIRLGHRAPGWFPFSYLCGGTLPSTLGCAARSGTHWAHAKFILAECTSVTESIGKLAYSGLVRAVRGVSTDVAPNFIRFERRWCTEQGETYTRDVRPILYKLPACQLPDGTPDMERVARFDQPIDLAEYGYPSLSPIWGCRIYGHFLPTHDPSQINIVLPTKAYANEQNAQFRPKYQKGPRDVEAAWKVIEEACPNINRDAITLLVAARGCAEGDISMPPMVFISGPTSSAKSSSVVVAAAICGDRNSSVVWTNNVERVRQSVKDAKDEGTFVTFNEVLKEGKRSGGSLVQTMDFILNLTADSRSHKLYVGSVSLGGVPVCVWTDTDVPYEIKQDAQLARRLVHIHLAAQVDWRSSLKASGVNQVHLLRFDSRRADACNVILSDVIDRFFREPKTFEEIANELGFRTLAESTEAMESRDTLMALFRAVCAAPALSGADARRWSSRGWKLVESDGSSELDDLWRQVSDEHFTSSRRCSEVDWAKMIGAKVPVEFEIRSHGQHRVAIRFAHHESQKRYLVNEELI